MKKQLLTLILLSLNATAVFATQWPDFPILFSTGTAEKETPPDIATITFSVSVFDEKSEKALAIVKKQSLEIINFYFSLGLDKDNLEAYDIDKTVVREDKDYTELKILGYEVNQKFTIILPALDNYTTFMDRLLKTSNLSNIATKFDIAERKQIESELIKEACADAKRKAENMANGMNASLEYPYAISEDGFHSLNEFFGISNPNPPMFKKSQHKESDTAKITYIPSRIKISKSVNVIYRLSNK